MAHIPVPADVEAALTDPEVARAAGDRAVLLIGGAPLEVRWANEAALALFQAEDFAAATQRAIDSSDPGAKRFRQLAGLLRPGGQARSETLRFRLGAGFETLTWRIRRLQAPGSVLAAALESPQPSAGAQAPPEERVGKTRGPQASFGPDDAWMGGPGRVRADLSRRDPGARTLRFLWRTGSDNRICDLSGPVCEVIGCAREDLIGKDFAAAAERLGADPAGLVRDALASPETWSNLRLLWPTGGAALPVTLGAVPVFGADRIFEGWRGFGVIDVSAPAPAPSAPPEEAAAPEPALAPEPEEAESAAASDLAPHSSFGPNVVALRRLQLVRSAAASRAPSAEAPPAAASNQTVVDETVQSDADESPGRLTRSERLAFDEIALALGARPPLYERDRVHEHPDATPDELPSAQASESADDAAAPNRAADESAVGAASIERDDEASAVGDDADALRALADRSPFGAMLSREDEIIWVNDALARILGFENSKQAIEPDGPTARLRALGAAARSEAGKISEIAATDRNGEPVPIEAGSHAVDWRGRPATLTLLRRVERLDATRVKFLEAELRRRDAEARELHAILDTATDGVAVLDEHARLISLNRAGEALFGCDQNDVAGEPFTMLLSPDSHAAALDYFRQVASNGVASLLNDGREIVGRARRGGAIPVFMTLGRINAGGASKFCAVLRDMTSWKKVERELNEARSEAERASALKSDFLAKVSHEIRTPLNAILGFAEVIMDERFGPVGNERYRDYLKDIHASGTHVMSLVNDLLDLSKIEAGKMELKFDSVDANKIVAECVSIMQPQANSERVIVRLSTAARLPQVMADERSLRQIVLNILSNAVKFNEPGGQVIVSTALTDAGHAVIRIRDTGIGMSEAELITALEPFRQVQTTRHTSGTGLGLPLTKALVEANHASFTVKSKKAEGTLVEVAFPPACVMAE